MDSFASVIRQQLEPFQDKVFYCGLSENELHAIEQEIGRSFPEYYREFLKVFGVRQDLVFGLLRKERDFGKQSKYLPDEIKASFIVIGDNGGEDCWLLNTDNHEDMNVYEWQHWLHGDVVSLGYDFTTLIRTSIEDLKNTAHQRAANDRKRWSVQFSISTDEEWKIYATIPLLRTTDWEFKETSPAHVHSYEVTATLGDRTVILKRLEYAEWATPLYFFGLSEPVSEFGPLSLIKEIDAALSAAFSEYTLVDYGILVMADSGS